MAAAAVLNGILALFGLIGRVITYIFAGRERTKAWLHSKDGSQSKTSKLALLALPTLAAVIAFIIIYVTTKQMTNPFLLIVLHVVVPLAVFALITLPIVIHVKKAGDDVLAIIESNKRAAEIQAEEAKKPKNPASEYGVKTVTAIAEDENQIRCPNCGTVQSVSRTFCWSCGSVFKKDEE